MAKLRQKYEWAFLCFTSASIESLICFIILLFAPIMVTDKFQYKLGPFKPLWKLSFDLFMKTTEKTLGKPED